MSNKQAECTDVDEQQLVRQAAAGSREAFARIVDEHQRWIRAWLWQLLGNADEVDDVAQEVFIACLRGVDRFQQGSTLRTWLTAIARNRAIARLRQRRRQLSADVVSIVDLIDQHQLARADRDRGEINDTIERLHECLQQLIDRHRRLIERVYFDGTSAVEIARETREPPSTIRMKLMRIRQVLGDCIERQTELPDSLSFPNGQKR